MSRNPYFAFVETDTNALLQNLIQMYQKITGRTLSPASNDRLFLQWVANAMLILLCNINFAGNQNLPSRAEGENLDALGELFQNLERPPAKRASTTIRFHIAGPQPVLILIPQGTRMTDPSNLVRWQTLADTHIPIGSTDVDVLAECMSPGRVGNGFTPGQISTLIDTGTILHFDRLENVTVSDGGTDEATDDEYYELMRLSQGSYSTAGAKNAYVYHAKKVSTEIRDVVPISPASGQVDIFVLMQDGTIAGDEIKSKVYAACNADDVRPLTDKVTVQDAEIIEYNIDFTYYIPSHTQMSVEEIEAAVYAAVCEYKDWQSGMLGRDIVPDALRHRVRNTGGVKRVEVREPVFTVLADGKVSSETSIPQIAKIGKVTIVNGGFEDE